MVKVYVIDETNAENFSAAIENALNKECKGMANLIVNTYVSNGFETYTAHYVAVITDNQIPQITIPTNNRRI